MKYIESIYEMNDSYNSKGRDLILSVHVQLPSNLISQIIVLSHSQDGSFILDFS